ncbi:MAG: hypothetical protein KatS3mg118_3218 [Paracoccaceae bacterium]|nr:MAG: hypothetical protein KatS3mg118_3218 [Paracoccaceae bacterium]
MRRGGAHPCPATWQPAPPPDHGLAPSRRSGGGCRRDRDAVEIPPAERSPGRARGWPVARPGGAGHGHRVRALPAWIAASRDRALPGGMVPRCAAGTARSVPGQGAGPRTAGHRKRSLSVRGRPVDIGRDSRSDRISGKVSSMSSFERLCRHWPGKGADPSGREHPAVLHMLDVAAVAEALIAPLPFPDGLKQALVLLSALHDLGKISGQLPAPCCARSARRRSATGRSPRRCCGITTRFWPRAWAAGTEGAGSSTRPRPGITGGRRNANCP